MLPFPKIVLLSVRWPCSINVKIATDVMGFVTLAIRNRLDDETGWRVSRSVTPKHCSHRDRPLRATAIESPGMLFFLMKPVATSVMAWRSARRMSSSGRRANPSTGRRAVAATPTATEHTALLRANRLVIRSASTFNGVNKLYLPLYAADETQEVFQR